MGWKYTKRLTRMDIISAITENIHKLTDTELENFAERFNDHESTGYPLGHGTNYTIVGEEINCCNCCMEIDRKSKFCPKCGAEQKEID